MTAGRRDALMVVVLLAMPAHAWAESVVCSTIRSGETAAAVAARITGAAANRHESWFQIRDTATNQFIEKSRYERVNPGWQACIVSETAKRGEARAEPTDAAQARMHGANDVVLLTALALSIALVGSGLHDYVRDRAAPLRRFGERFVHEFARPLVQVRPSEPAVDARLRVRPYRAQVDVLLAPRGGRPYPNLVDHKHNVEYDVERVLTVLEDQRFTHGPLYAQGRWVVVPLHLQVNPKQAGGR